MLVFGGANNDPRSRWPVLSTYVNSTSLDGQGFPVSGNHANQLAKSFARLQKRHEVV